MNQCDCNSIIEKLRKMPFRWGKTKKPFVLAIATMDTKAYEIECIAKQIRDNGKVDVRIVDVTTLAIALSKSLPQPDVSRKKLLTFVENGADEDGKNNIEDRPKKQKLLADALINYCSHLIENDELFSGMIGIGGSCGTAIISPAMRSVPIGFPKIMVSTMASGDVGPYVGFTDVTMMHSVADIAGVNAVTRVVLENAASAVEGMADGWAKRNAAATKKAKLANRTKKKPTLGMTQFGVTTVCCEAVRKELENDYEIVTFHATGAGGRAMEKLMEDGLLSGVLDLTTTEIADEIGGGVLSAGPERLDAFASAKVPMVMSLGALDMVNFGGEKTVPSKHSDRKLHVHNSEVTLMRTSEEECRKIASFIAKKFNKSVAPAVLLIPSKGVSLIDVPGMPFYDPTVDTVLFDELNRLIEERDGDGGKGALRKVVTIDCAINDPEFAVEVAKWYRKLAKLV
mmetsp:Transcript_8766/g.10243  ORF Transcript_8766/g.10243 Transcript_8766/m.10243 type:complete len:456 (+) Transcript_8766:90-1457(+)